MCVKVAQYYSCVHIATCNKKKLYIPTSIRLKIKVHVEECGYMSSAHFEEYCASPKMYSFL